MYSKKNPQFFEHHVGPVYHVKGSTPIVHHDSIISCTVFENPQRFWLQCQWQFHSHELSQWKFLQRLKHGETGAFGVVDCHTDTVVPRRAELSHFASGHVAELRAP